MKNKNRNLNLDEKIKSIGNILNDLYEENGKVTSTIVRNYSEAIYTDIKKIFHNMYKAREYFNIAQIREERSSWNIDKIVSRIKLISQDNIFPTRMKIKDIDIKLWGAIERYGGYEKVKDYCKNNHCFIIEEQYDKDLLCEDDIIKFLQKNFYDTGKVPKQKEWVEKNGFPCSREYLRLNFSQYNILLEKAGLPIRKPFNAKGDSLTLDDVIIFLRNFYKINGRTPNLSEFKVKDGFPCNKEFLVKHFGKYNEVLKKAGLQTYEFGQRHYNIEELLINLRKAILDSRSFDIKVLSKKYGYIKHRDTYTRLFGSFEKALIEAGIDNRHKVLMRLYSDYKLEEPVKFLIHKFGIDGEFTNGQKKLIHQINEAVIKSKGDLRRDTLKYTISLHLCKKLFGRFSVALIAAGFVPNLSMGSCYCAKDGHICDSYEEALVDDILYKLNIKHDIHENYPNSPYKCDFKIDDKIFIEYIGFSKINDEYLRNSYLDRLEEKKKIAKENNINLQTEDYIINQLKTLNLL